MSFKWVWSLKTRRARRERRTGRRITRQGCTQRAIFGGLGQSQIKILGEFLKIYPQKSIFLQCFTRMEIVFLIGFVIFIWFLSGILALCYLRVLLDNEDNVKWGSQQSKKRNWKGKRKEIERKTEKKEKNEDGKKALRAKERYTGGHGKSQRSWGMSANAIVGDVWPQTSWLYDLGWLGGISVHESMPDNWHVADE